MRMTASWSGSQPTYRIQVCGVRIRANGELPSDHTHNSNLGHPAWQSPISGFIVPPRAQASRRCETQAPLGGKAAKLCYRFGPLTPSAPSANLIPGDGMKNGFPAPNKELARNQKQPLERKSPIQVRIRFPSAASHQRTVRPRVSRKLAFIRVLAQPGRAVVRQDRA
jgi:hypothetical protein